MIHLLIDTTKAAHLFKGWEESMIWSCLQKVMGKIYVDNLEHPQSAITIIGDFTFLAGKPKRELLMFNNYKNFKIMVPQSQEWEKLICSHFGKQAKPITRYATKKNTRFDIPHLENIISQ